MRWFAAAAFLLLLALAFGLGLLAYAMYALLAVLVSSRILARASIANVTAVRECNRLAAGVGETVAVVVTVKNVGRVPVLWLLLEDLLPREALVHEPPNLRVRGKRLPDWVVAGMNYLACAILSGVVVWILRGR